VKRVVKGVVAILRGSIDALNELGEGRAGYELQVVIEGEIYRATDGEWDLRAKASGPIGAAPVVGSADGGVKRASETTGGAAFTIVIRPREA
jgi:hypothetical protein